MAAPHRFGLELEMHGIMLTFRQRGTTNFWPLPAAGVLMENTMITVESVMVPLNVGAGFLIGGTQNINWESNWGFRAVGDGHGRRTISPPAGNATEAGYCILELATAAAPVNDYNYWVTSRKCAKQFVATMEHYLANNPADVGRVQDGARWWYPLQSFINAYNGNVQANVGAPDTFKLAKSTPILNFENGTHANAAGHNWDAYVLFLSTPSDRWCDVQVNYQLPVRKLYTDTDAWIAAWSSIWASRTALGPIDPEVGDTKNAPSMEPYRVQTYAAMWRLAKSQVDTRLNVPNALAPHDTLVKALLMYILVAMSVSNVAEGNSSPKNSWPQLPKTSPASIAREIVAMHGPAAAFFATMAATAPVPAPPARLPWAEAQAISLEQLRSKAMLTPPPGNLPTTPLQAGASLFSVDDGGILRAPNPPNVKETWLGSLTLDPAHALAPGAPPGNKMGFTTAAPFYVRWAEDVNSSYAATPYSRTGIGANNELKMLFESRYGRCVLNIGFNPYLSDFLFNRSYKSMLRLLAGPPAVQGTWQMSDLAGNVDLAFPDDPSVKQDFHVWVH